MSVSRAGKTCGLLTGANKKTLGSLEQEGADIILFPAPEIEAIVIDRAAQGLLQNITEFDWLVFADVFAVDFFLLALEKLEVDFYELDSLRICAFGETVADRLRFAQVHSDVISNRLETTEVFQALKAYDPLFDGARVLIPKESKSKPEIVARLTETGARVTTLDLYETHPAAGGEESIRLPKLKALLKGGAIDEFIFGSPNEVANSVILFRPEKLSDLLAGITVSALDSSTAQALREHGLVPLVRLS